MSEFLTIAEGGAPRLIASAVDGVNALTICDAWRRSAATGGIEQSRHERALCWLSSPHGRIKGIAENVRPFAGLWSPIDSMRLCVRRLTVASSRLTVKRSQNVPAFTEATCHF
jgi:hypothetical protein